jgi:hypothetical protein
MALADVLIWLDDAQFSKGSFTSRVQVKTAGGVKWLSIPLAGQGSFQEIRNLVPANPEWWRPHRALLTQALQSQPFLAQALTLFEAMPAGGPLVDSLIGSAEGPARAMGVLPRRILRASSMQISGGSWERVLRMVKSVGGTHYITGHGALAYLDHGAFEADGIAVSYMDYRPAPWPQSHGAFTPCVTCLDLLASLPAESAAAHLCPATLDWRAFKAHKEQTA